MRGFGPLWRGTVLFPTFWRHHVPPQRQELTTAPQISQAMRCCSQGVVWPDYIWQRGTVPKPQLPKRELGARQLRLHLGSQGRRVWSQVGHTPEPAAYTQFPQQSQLHHPTARAVQKHTATCHVHGCQHNIHAPLRSLFRCSFLCSYPNSSANFTCESADIWFCYPELQAWCSPVSLASVRTSQTSLNCKNCKPFPHKDGVPHREHTFLPATWGWLTKYASEWENALTNSWTQKWPNQRWWVGHVERNAYRVLMGKPEGKIPLGRPKQIYIYILYIYIYIYICY
jgi:hypothetical protein